VTQTVKYCFNSLNNNSRLVELA